MPCEEDDWTRYTSHRDQFTGAILSMTRSCTDRLCILGAGQCNDVDLGELSTAFSEIHLVDIDPAALGKAVARQQPAVRSKLRVHARVDLSGIATRLRKWKRRPPGAAQVDQAAEAAIHGVLARLPGPFDVVASACVLTQMAFTVRSELGDAHPMLSHVRSHVVAAHLRTLVGLTAGGGSALFVSDLTSSSMFPLDRLDPTHSLRDAMDDIVASGQYYHSANPALVAQLLHREDLQREFEAPVLLEPWLWSGTLGRTYFVYAVRIRRHAASP